MTTYLGPILAFPLPTTVYYPQSEKQTSSYITEPQARHISMNQSTNYCNLKFLVKIGQLIRTLGIRVLERPTAVRTVQKDSSSTSAKFDEKLTL